MLELTTDELLATTRSVRRRLDLTRPVEREVLEDCLRLAQQAPSSSYAQNWHFVVVTDAGERAALGELWRTVAGPYLERRAAAAVADPRIAHISDSVRHLAAHIHEVPVHVIPCVEGRTDGDGEHRSDPSRVELVLEHVRLEPGGLLGREQVVVDAEWHLCPQGPTLPRAAQLSLPRGIGGRGVPRRASRPG